MIEEAAAEEVCEELCPGGDGSFPPFKKNWLIGWLEANKCRVLGVTAFECWASGLAFNNILNVGAVTLFPSLGVKFSSSLLLAKVLALLWGVVAGLIGVGIGFLGAFTVYLLIQSKLDEIYADVDVELVTNFPPLSSGNVGRVYRQEGLGRSSDEDPTYYYSEHEAMPLSALEQRFYSRAIVGFGVGVLVAAILAAAVVIAFPLVGVGLALSAACPVGGFSGAVAAVCTTPLPNLKASLFDEAKGLLGHGLDKAQDCVTVC